MTLCDLDLRNCEAEAYLNDASVHMKTVEVANGETVSMMSEQWQ